MRLDRFTIKVQESIEDARKLASRRGHHAIEVEHLALALTEQQEGIVRAILSKAGSHPQWVSDQIEKELARLARVEGGVNGDYITPRLNKIFETSSKEAAQFKDEYVSSEHVLLAIATEDGGITASRR